MNYEFSKIIDSIHSELQPTYLAGFYKWADEHRNVAFTRAVDLLEKELVRCFSVKDVFAANCAAEEYKHQIISLIAEYKKEMNMDETKRFLESLEFLTEMDHSKIDQMDLHLSDGEERGLAHRLAET